MQGSQLRGEACYFTAGLGPRGVIFGIKDLSEDEDIIIEEEEESLSLMQAETQTTREPGDN